MVVILQILKVNSEMVTIINDGQNKHSQKLKIGLIVDSNYSSKYVYDLASWAKEQINLEVMTCPGIFRPNAFRDNGSFNLRSRYEESTVFRRKNFSDIARGRSQSHCRIQSVTGSANPQFTVGPRSLAI